MNNQEPNAKMRDDNEFCRDGKIEAVDKDFFAMCEKHSGEVGNCSDQCHMRYVPNCYSEYFYMRGYEDGQKDAVKHGHWIWYYTSKEELKNGVIMYTPHFMCSVCEHRYESYRRYDEPKKEDADFPRFCEHCGAKMDEEVE